MLRWEIKKLTKNVWNPIILAGVTCIWGIILYFSVQNGPDQFLVRSSTFWNVLGSLAVGFIILFVNTGLFILDEEEKVREVILTTRYGKVTVLYKRLMATVIYTTWIVTLLLIVQIIGFLIFNHNEIDSVTAFIMVCMKNFLYIWIGSVLFSIFAACICTIFKSHTVTAIITGVLFGMTYVLRGNLLQQYSFEWFLEMGFFSYLIRANDIILEPQLGTLTVWYGLLMVAIIILMIKMQSRRHEL